MERSRSVGHDRRPRRRGLTPSAVFVEHVAAVAIKVAQKDIAWEEPEGRGIARMEFVDHSKGLCEVISQGDRHTEQRIEIPDLPRRRLRPCGGEVDHMIIPQHRFPRRCAGALMPERTGFVEIGDKNREAFDVCKVRFACELPDIFFTVIGLVAMRRGGWEGGDRLGRGERKRACELGMIRDDLWGGSRESDVATARYVVSKGDIALEGK